MNIYKKKLKSRNKFYVAMFLWLLIYTFAFTYSLAFVTTGIIHPLLWWIWLAITLGLTYSFLIEPYNELCEEIEDIKNIIARHFWEDVVHEILENFDEKELNKTLAIAKEKEQEEEVEETNIINEKIKDIKEKINHFELKETKAKCCC